MLLFVFIRFWYTCTRIEQDILAAVNAQVMLVAPVGPDSGGRSSEVQQLLQVLLTVRVVLASHIFVSFRVVEMVPHSTRLKSA